MKKYYAVIGNPIQHSLSPEMHNAGYKAMGINADYRKFRVEAAQLPEAVRGLFALGFSGWNVTLPYKEAILPYLDELTPQAKRAGAVNTVKILDGQMIGHNTDGEGFVRSVKEDMDGFKGKKAVILGAGGAGKGIALALAERGMSLVILNRTPDKAKELVRMLQQQGATAQAGELAQGEWLKDTDLLVQTTSVGLKKERFPFSLQGISPKTLVTDIIFNPRETMFLQEARQLGCRTKNGLEMLLYQGALAWEFWLGGKAPVGAMKRALEEQLLNRETSEME